MHATTIAIDLAKSVFQLAVRDQVSGQITHHRLTRSQFKSFFHNRVPAKIIMEACASAHYWARTLQEQDHQVVLLPPQYVRPFVRRNKTDKADAMAILEASQRPDILPVAVKPESHQAIQGLHRIRSQWIATRTARINLMRGLLSELGILLPAGAANGLNGLPSLLEDAETPIPHSLRGMLWSTYVEVREIERRLESLKQELEDFAQQNGTVQKLMSVPGIGLLGATALSAAIPDIKAFRNGRHLSSWLGITPKEYSSGQQRHLGRISKRGDPYIRTLLIHGARAVLNRATQLQRAGKPLNRLQQWALALQARSNHNKAAVGVANKMARMVWAVWHHDRTYDANFVVA